MKWKNKIPINKKSIFKEVSDYLDDIRYNFRRRSSYFCPSDKKHINFNDISTKDIPVQLPHMSLSQRTLTCESCPAAPGLSLARVSKDHMDPLFKATLYSESIWDKDYIIDEIFSPFEASSMMEE